VKPPDLRGGGVVGISTSGLNIELSVHAHTRRLTELLPSELEVGFQPRIDRRRALYTGCTYCKMCMCSLAVTTPSPNPQPVGSRTVNTALLDGSLSQKYLNILYQARTRAPSR